MGSEMCIRDSQNMENGDEELKCVAMALLPPEIMEGSRVAYEMLQYFMAE